MSDFDVQEEQKSMSIFSALGIYTALLIVTFSNLDSSFFLLLYLASGFVMNRIVLRRLIDWHPVYNTLENVSRGKLSMFLFWPLSYIVLFARIAIVKIL